MVWNISGGSGVWMTPTSALTSAPVRTATTPGIFLAAVVSIRLITAWAWGLRVKASQSAPSSPRRTSLT